MDSTSSLLWSLEQLLLLLLRSPPNVTWLKAIDAAVADAMVCSAVGPDLPHKLDLHHQFPADEFLRN